jgi:hypothetical protein
MKNTVRGFALALLATTATQAHAQEQKPRYDNPALERLASPELTTFEDDRDFRDYLRVVRRIERRRRDRQARLDADTGTPTFVIAAATMQETEPGLEPQDVCTDPEQCPEEDADVVTVTGSRLSAPASLASPIAVTGAEASITNNQVLGVDEGDIVKRIGDHLLVLQDGRIFVADFRSMVLTDRIDVYRRDTEGEPIAADWYDEMLVQGDQVIVTAYNYEEEASEISVFGFDRAAGKLTRRGVFLLTSEDYYDTDNYATRVVGDKLVIYTPYEPEQLASRAGRPVLRRWTPGDDFDEAKDKGRQILDADDIYRPVFGVSEPIVHTVSICPLDRLDERGLACRSTGFIGGERAEMYVGREAAFLYVAQAGEDDFYDLPNCKIDGRARSNHRDVALGAIYRLDLDGRDPRVIGVRGAPFDQFSFGEDEERFRMLSQWQRKDCDNYIGWGDPETTQPLALFDIDGSRFDDRFEVPGEAAFAPVPDAANSRVVNRFVGDWLVYGARANWSGRPSNLYSDYSNEAFMPGTLQAVPLADPARTSAVALTHQITRIEAMPRGVFVTGYDLREGLILGYLDLSGDPRISETQFLEYRYESENRSHAFNAALTVDGGAIMGLPTVVRRKDSGRYWWYSDSSDISFLLLSQGGSLTDLGAIAGKREEEVETAEGYDCEVSCIDWYGNARPIFIDGAIYGLMGTDLVRVKLSEGAVAVDRRLDLTAGVGAKAQ